ncbi:MAG: thymidine phosphorylase, partial [Anaerolineaceae bacterium]|nr:thymidine phosphorylase [Anaerolineaceae bacterium]
TLSRDEINFFIEGFTSGTIADYQASALAMAILLNGMTDQETTNLTLAMSHSGEVLDLSGVVPIAVDKHSTGGVGDKTTLVVEPLVACCGLPVGKMSGRGLGFSGGTLDKMESIPGFRVNLTKEEFMAQLGKEGLVLAGQSADLAPADGKMYSLRDVTGTVQSIALIASSVMSKKIAAGAQAIVLDVKVGNGAFMQTIEEARKLSVLMVAIGKLSGRRTVAILSDMNQPLGHAIGNALEVKEAIETLHGQGPADFREHCMVVASHLLVVGNKAKNLEDARIRVETALKDGSAWKMFRRLVEVQGGDLSVVDDPEKLARAPITEVVKAEKAGYLKMVHARTFGETSVELGAGRAVKSDSIDHAVGIVVHQKVGDHVAVGDPLYTIHANDQAKLMRAKQSLLPAVEITSEPVQELPLFYGVIE